MILVVGGTGRLGGHVVRVLRSVGLDVRCLVRKGSEYFWLNDSGTAYFFGDLRDPQSLSRALRDVQYLVSCAGVRVEKTQNNHKTMADGHVALWEAAKARGTVEHVVYVSCAAAADPADVPALTSKRASEDALIQSGLSYTILRPGLYSANIADLLRRMEFNGSVFLPGNPDTKISPVYGRDVGLMAMAALDLPEVRNQIIDVGGPETMTVREAFDRGCAAAGLQPSSWAMPAAGLRTLATLAQPVVKRWTNHLKALEAYYTRDHVVDGAAVAARFGIPLTPYDEAVRFDWENRHPSEDPLARDEKVVHRQFVATIYEPGVTSWESLPDGPPPRQD